MVVMFLETNLTAPQHVSIVIWWKGKLTCALMKVLTFRFSAMLSSIQKSSDFVAKIAFLIYPCLSMPLNLFDQCHPHLFSPSSCQRCIASYSSLSCIPPHVLHRPRKLSVFSGPWVRHHPCTPRPFHRRPRPLIRLGKESSPQSILHEHIDLAGIRIRPHHGVHIVDLRLGRFLRREFENGATRRNVWGCVLIGELRLQEWSAEALDHVVAFLGAGVHGRNGFHCVHCEADLGAPA